jgi:hypothetical protein|nr:MAG TPA: hypothetical protein [Caudoviricetes sp.]
MAKVLRKEEKKDIRFSDAEFDKVLSVPLKDGSRINVIRFVKKSGTTTVYCNRHPEISWELLGKFFNSLPDYQQEVNDEEEVEFAL